MFQDLVVWWIGNLVNWLFDELSFLYSNDSLVLWPNDVGSNDLVIQCSDDLVI
jgi:hypothetical protein